MALNFPHLVSEDQLEARKVFSFMDRIFFNERKALSSLRS